MKIHITTTHLPTTEVEEQINSYTSMDIGIAEEIMEMIFSKGEIRRNEIKLILEKFPGHSYRLPVNQTPSFHQP